MSTQTPSAPQPAGEPKRLSTGAVVGIVIAAVVVVAAIVVAIWFATGGSAGAQATPTATPSSSIPSPAATTPDAAATESPTPDTDPTQPAPSDDIAEAAAQWAAAITAAVGVVTDGDETGVNALGATSIEVADDGWLVVVERSDGYEVDVQVPMAASPTVGEKRADSGVPVIDQAKLADIMTAAIAQISGGEVTAIRTEKGGDHFYTVEVTGSGGVTTVALTEDLRTP
ncbi:hypothetical protein ACFQRL_01265 [Microbacterium fluvii]|uniref:PepSY domain-containing protein n=1 Tax=Microbacterium fluvii TaxID=415215 RepID=A0ABW2H988_9MICO|nr:hypothetical protein [Microbacterium fluvii]MCU4671216.1 hypothetical protein [Microbacterium fluvii]